MKALKLNATVIIILIFLSCGVKDKKTDNCEFKEKITVAYFHGERRCETCIAVGDLAKITVEENYKNNKDVVFRDINIDEKENEAIAEKYEIAGSALLIIVDGKAEDITGFAFKNAIINPDIIKEKIKDIVNNAI